MSGHVILHVMDGSRDTSVLEPRLEQLKFSVSFLEEIIKESGTCLGYEGLKNEQIKTIISCTDMPTQHVSVVHGHKNWQCIVCARDFEQC